MKEREELKQHTKESCFFVASVSIQLLGNFVRGSAQRDEANDSGAFIRVNFSLTRNHTAVYQTGRDRSICALENNQTYANMNKRFCKYNIQVQRS